MSALLAWIIAYLVFIGIGVLFTIESRRARRLKGLPPPQGFGGWLIVLAIHESIQWINPTRELVTAWGLLPNFTAQIDFVLLLPYLGMIFFTIVAMYRRRRYFKYAYLVQAGYTLMLEGMIAATTPWQGPVGAQMGRLHGQIVGSALAAITWTIYIFTSERAKNTFVRPEPVTRDVVQVF